MSGGDRRKLYFALWPDAETRQRLVEAAAAFTAGGVRMPAENLHLTLVFNGFVDGAQQACLEAAAERIDAPAFDVRLDRVGSFGRKILWLGSRQPPAALFELQRRMAAAFQRDCGFQPEARPYRPHVTIERKLEEPLEAELGEAVVWHADRFALVQSIASTVTGQPPVYRVLRQWPLGNGERGQGDDSRVQAL